jgi:hypothetical protein
MLEDQARLERGREADISAAGIAHGGEAAVEHPA